MTVDRRGWRVRLLTLWLPLGVSLLFALFPFYWMAVTSLKSNQELYSRKVMPLIVHNPTLKHYVDLLTETNFLLWTWNTFLVAVTSTAISLVLGAMLAYPLARLRFAGATMISFAVAATYLVPQPLLFVPLADLINRLGLGDTLTSVILTYPTLLIPFCAWLLMGYFRTVPIELEDAARIDGASRLQTLVKIVLPLVRPGLHLGRHLRLHPGAERVPLRPDLPDQDRGAHGAGRRHRRAGARRRVLLGPADGGRPARLDSRWPSSIRSSSSTTSPD